MLLQLHYYMLIPFPFIPTLTPFILLIPSPFLNPPIVPPFFPPSLFPLFPPFGLFSVVLLGFPACSGGHGRSVNGARSAWRCTCFSS